MMGDSVDCPDNLVRENILKILPKLHANNAKIRLNSASQLLEILSKNKDNEESLEENLCFIVERLIKGTTKAKDSFKIGSTLLLTEILHSFSDFRISKLLELSKKIIGDVNDDLSISGVTSWTCIFISIVQSKKLDISDKETLKEFIRFMVQLAIKKPLCNIAICNIFQMLFDHQFKPEAFSSILKSSLKRNEHGDASPFYLYLILLIRKHPELSRVLNHIPSIDLDDADNLVAFVEAAALNYPTLHPACIELFHYINEDDRMEIYWKRVFNNTLFGHDQSSKHHRVGLSLISAILPHLNETNVDYVFSKKMMDLWMQSLTTQACRLHNFAMQLQKDLIDNYDNYDASLQAKIILLLTESPGTVSFDVITDTKTVAQLYSKTKCEAVENLINRVIEKVRGYKDVSVKDKMRTLLVSQLTDLVKSAHIADSPEIKLTVLNFLLAHGYFDVSNDETLNLVKPATGSLIARIQSLFFKLISATCSNNPDVMEGVGLYALRLIKGGVPLKDDKTEPLWKKMKKMKIKFKKLKSDVENEKQINIFKPLLYANAISSFQQSTDIDDAIANFDELFECFKRSLGDSQEENEPKWPDVLLDLMISQFPAQSQFLSSIMIKTFRLIVSDVTLEGLEQLKIALLADKLDDEEDENENDSEDEDEDEDAEENGPNGQDADKPEGESDEEESEVSEDDEEDVDDEFKAKITLALGPAAATGDETEAPIDDDEMFQLDEALSAAFRSKYSTDRHTKANLKILRSKCLDLVEIIFKSKEQTLETVLFLIPVLIDAIKLYSNSKEVELRARVAKILMNLPHVKFFTSSDGLNDKIAQGLFKKGIDLASNTNIQTSAAKICVWVISMCIHSNVNTDWAYDHLLKLLEEYFSKPNSLVSKDFFLIIFQNQKTCNPQILEVLSKNVFVSLRPFKKLGGLAMLTTYLRICPVDMVKDKSIEACLQSIKKDAMAGLMAATSANRASFISLYVGLIGALSKFIPIDPLPVNAKKKEKVGKKLSSNGLILLKKNQEEEEESKEEKIDVDPQSDREDHENKEEGEEEQEEQEEQEENEEHEEEQQEDDQEKEEDVEVEEEKDQEEKNKDEGEDEEEEQQQGEEECEEEEEVEKIKSDSQSENDDHEKEEESSEEKMKLDSQSENENEKKEEEQLVKKMKLDLHLENGGQEEEEQQIVKKIKLDSQSENENEEKEEAPEDVNMKQDSQSESENQEKREEERVAKRIKFESESEEQEEAPTPRVTRARAKTPKVEQNKKPEPETKEEQLEAEDELPDFSIPRVQLIKTPSTRSRARSVTPTKEPTTPLRRSLRTRK